MKTAQELVQQARAQCREIPVEQAALTLGAAGLIVDVREPDEYAAGHLPGAINLPRGVLEFRLSASPETARRDLGLLLYCQSGGRAALAAVSLQAMGYDAVVSMAGGYAAWMAGGRPVAQPAAGAGG